MKKSVTPSYQEIIRLRRYGIEKAIRHTKRPIFNIWRLLLGPCHRFSCKDATWFSHNSKPNDMMVAFIGASVCTAIISTIFSVIFRKFGFYPTPALNHAIHFLLGVWTYAHFKSRGAWRAHESELAAERDHLTKQLLPSTLLRDSLHEDIGRVRAKLLGKGGGLVKWCETLDARAKIARSRNTSETPIQPPDDLVSYRSAPGGVRIELADERDILLRAKTGIHALEQTTRERLERLMDDARALGSLLDTRAATEALPLTQETAGTSLARIDTAIQQGVEAFYAELQALEQDGLRACEDAGSALAADVAAEAEEVALAMQREDLVQTKS